MYFGHFSKGLANIKSELLYGFYGVLLMGCSRVPGWMKR